MQKSSIGERRHTYLALANEVDATICSFCKYWECQDCQSGGECNHPLFVSTRFADAVDSAMQMGDCWGFRPGISLELATGIVGIILKKGWWEWNYWQDKGQWKVAGRKE